MAGDLLPFDDLWPLIAREVELLQTEVVSLGVAARRILRRSARAAWDLPRADNSAMDGFAVRFADTESPLPAVLKVLAGDAYAGSPSSSMVAPECALPIATGGLVPAGADAVVPKENAVTQGSELKVLTSAKLGDHIRRKGEELLAGDVVYEAGRSVDPVARAAMMIAGISQVEVTRLPVVRVLASGNEIVQAGVESQPGQVVDSNGPFLAAAVSDLLGVAIPPSMIVKDDSDELTRVFGAALDEADVLVLSGGVSVGDRDLIKPVLEDELGVRRLVWRVAQKPGKPLYVGRRGTTWVIGLPGNPAAVIAMWTVVVRPLILALMGASTPQPPRLRVRLDRPVKPNRSRTHLRWCQSSWKDDLLWVQPLERSDSHMLSDLARADLFLIVPPGDEVLAAGTQLDAVRIDR